MQESSARNKDGQRSHALFRLAARDLSVGRDGECLLDGVNFSLESGSSLAVIGESGCGKSTLLQTLAGILEPVAGSVVIESDAGRKPKNGFVWQNLALFPWLCVSENLALPLKFNREVNIRERVKEMLSELELEGLEGRFPNELSGGQQQRLALGRALIANPDVLFMDEPFSALDAVLREHLQNFLMQLRQKHPCTMIFVTHDIAEAVALGESIMLLGARPSRVVRSSRNPAFSADLSADVRSTDVFYDVQRRLRAAFAAVRQGRDPENRAKEAW